MSLLVGKYFADLYTQYYNIFGFIYFYYIQTVFVYFHKKQDFEGPLYLRYC